MQQTDVPAVVFTKLLHSLMIDQQDPKYVGFSGIYNIIVNLIKLYTFLTHDSLHHESMLIKSPT